MATVVCWRPAAAGHCAGRRLRARFGSAGQLLLDARRLVRGQAAGCRPDVVEEATVSRKEIDQPAAGGALARLVAEIGRAAHAGWGPTARLLVLLVVVAAAAAVLMTAAGG